MLTKKKVLWISSIGVGFKLALMFFGLSPLFSWCYDRLWCQYNFIDGILYFIPYLTIFLPLFFFSLVTYWMREGVYQSWFRFARWWIPLSMLLILIMPSDTGGGGFGPQLSLGKGDVALATSFLFALISVTLIAYKFFTLRKDGAGK